MKKKVTNLIITAVIGVSMNGILTVPIYATPLLSETKKIIQIEVMPVITTPNNPAFTLSREDIPVIIDKKNEINTNDSIETKIQKYDNKIQESMIKIIKVNKEIDSNEKEIISMKIKIKNKQIEYDENFNIFQQRARIMYVNGGGYSVLINYVDAVTSGKNILDVVDKIDTLRIIAKMDNEIMNEVKKAQEELKIQEKIIIAQEKQLITDRTAIENELNIITKDKEVQLRLLAEQNQIRLLIRGNSIQAPFKMSPDASARAISVITEGQKYLGIPYVWGGTTPSGFDCSGFTQYILNKNGINIPRVAEDQQQVGMSVSSSQIQPGDLVFFGYPAHHVGVYVGGGQFMHAPHTGDVVKISGLDLGTVTTVKRVLY